MTSRELLALAVVAAPALAALETAVVPRRAVDNVARIGAVAQPPPAAVLATVALAPRTAHSSNGGSSSTPRRTARRCDRRRRPRPASLVSAGYLAAPSTTGLVRPERRPRVFYLLLFVFWAILAAIPLIGNLAGAWLLVEATTAASALLVGFGGKPRALEAGWKYLILTSLGLGVALLGIVILAAASPHGGLDALSWRQLAHVRAGHGDAASPTCCSWPGWPRRSAGRRCTTGCPTPTPRHPPPSRRSSPPRCLPTVLFVAWRSSQALSPVIGASTAHSVLVGFGLLSLAVAVPFLWQAMPWKRLLAYSSLEHMGVIALGIGFGTPLALAGVAIHIAGHALAKALGFYAATPLLGHEPRAAGHPRTASAHPEPALGTVLGISLGALAGLPPSPLFVSEVLIIAGGFAAGRPWTACRRSRIARARLPRTRARADRDNRRRNTHRAAAGAGTAPGHPPHLVAVPCLLALTAAALWLPAARSRTRSSGDPMTYHDRESKRPSATATSSRASTRRRRDNRARRARDAPNGAISLELRDS